MKTKLMLLHDETGSAVLEFLVSGILLQVAVLMWLVNVTNLQSQQLAAESIARHSLRSYVLHGTQPENTAEQIVSDFASTARPILKLACEPDCLTEGSVLRMNVSLGSARAQSVLVR